MKPLQILRCTRTYDLSKKICNPTYLTVRTVKQYNSLSSSDFYTSNNPARYITFPSFLVKKYGCLDFLLSSLIAHS